MSSAAAVQRLMGGLRSLVQRPELRAGMTSGVIMGVGDVVCQSLQKTAINPMVPASKTETLSVAEEDLKLKSGSAGMQSSIHRESSSQSGDFAKKELSKTTFLPDLDFQRTLRFALVGLTLHGPYFWHGFRWLDATFGRSKSLQIAVAKTALGQAVVFPVYLSAFFVYMGKLEGKTWRECKTKLQQGFLPTYTSGCVFWPIANMFNFTMVPPCERVLYANAVGLVWNSYLSYANSKVANLRQEDLQPEPLHTSKT